MFDNSSVATVLFSAMRQQLEDLRTCIEEISPELQHRLLFQVPDLMPQKRQPKLGNLKLIPGPPGFLDINELADLRVALPHRTRLLVWERLFVASEDGVSLRTLLTKCENQMPLLLFVLTRDCAKLGAYLPSGLKAIRGYTGSGETFVFSFTPTFRIHRWSQKNQLFCTASYNEIAIGGGQEGLSAIFLSGALEKGFSGRCETFNSEPLTPKDHFDVLDVELWHLRVSVTKRVNGCV
jgi:hypothetical protein